MAVDKQFVQALAAQEPDYTIATGNLTLEVGCANDQIIDPGGAARDVTLPSATLSPGKFINVYNHADAAEAITVKNTAGDTVGTVAQNRMQRFAVKNGTWVAFGQVTIDIS